MPSKTFKNLNQDELNQFLNNQIIEDRPNNVPISTTEEIAIGGNESALITAGLNPNLISEGNLDWANEIGEIIQKAKEEKLGTVEAGKGEIYAAEMGQPTGELSQEELNEIFAEFVPSKTTRLKQAGISLDELDFVPRLFMEAGGMDDKQRMDNLRAYLIAKNPEEPVFVGKASELGDSIPDFVKTMTADYKETGYDPVLFKIGDQGFKVANMPGITGTELGAIITRELPVIVADAAGIIGGMKVGGPGGAAVGAGVGSAIGEVVVQGTADYMLAKMNGEDYTWGDFQELYDQIKDDAAFTGLSSAILTPVMKKVFDGILAIGSTATGKRVPGAITDIATKETVEKAGTRSTNIARDQINAELQNLVGKDASQIKFTLNQYLTDAEIESVLNYLKNFPSASKQYLDTVSNNIKETSDAVNTYLSNQTGVTPTGTIQSIGEIGAKTQGSAQVVQNTIIGGAQKDVAFDLNKLNTFLDVIETKAGKGGTVTVDNVENIAKANKDAFNAQKEIYDNTIKTVLKNVPGGGNKPFISTGTFRRDLYDLRKILNDSLIDADAGTVKLINQILESTSGVRKEGARGVAPAKNLTFQQAMSMLNGLNRLVDDEAARLVGGAADSGKISRIAAELRNELDRSLQKNLNPADYLLIKESLTNLKNLRQEYNMTAINKLFKSTKRGLEISDKNVFDNILKDEVAAKELFSIIGDNTTLKGEKELVQNYILNKYINEVTSNKTITDAGKLTKLASEWMQNNKLAVSFLDKETQNTLRNTTKTIKEYDISQKKLADLTKDLNKGTLGNLGNADIYTITRYLEKSPGSVGELLENLNKAGQKGLAKNLEKDIKQYFMEKLYKQITRPDTLTGGEMYSSKAIDQLLKNENRAIYEALFGKGFMIRLQNVGKALEPYDYVIGQGARVGSNITADALKNIFLGQLDRKRTLIRGITNFIRLQGFKGSGKALADVDEFMKRAKGMFNSPTDMERWIAGTVTQELGTPPEGDEASLLEQAGIATGKKVLQATPFMQEIIGQSSNAFKSLMERAGQSGYEIP